MKPGSTAASKVCVAMMSASGEVEISVVMELCLRVVDGKEIPVSGKPLAPIFKGKEDVSYNANKTVELLEPAMKIV